MSTVLIASLGDSPAIVSLMYDKLIDKGLHIDEVEILMPQTKDSSYVLIDDFLRDRTVITPIELDFEDANSYSSSFLFLQRLCSLLKEHTTKGDSVYLSLAGGRKNMSALMGWVVPLFLCIKGVYHLIDPNNDSFQSADELAEVSPEIQRQYMHPDKDALNKLKLVHIPGGLVRAVSENTLERLRTASDEIIEKMEEEEARAVIFTKQVFQTDDKALNVLLTSAVAEEFSGFYKKNNQRFHAFEICFDHMHFANFLKHHVHYWSNEKPPKMPFGTPYYFKRDGTAERPVFYTTSEDIYTAPSYNKIHDVIVCALEIEEQSRTAGKQRTGQYHSLKEIVNALSFDPKPVCSFEQLLAKLKKDNASTNGPEEVLIVPLGKSPMVVTQLYTLLKEQGHNIHEVVLVYPENSDVVHNAASLLTTAFKRESNATVKVRPAIVKGYGDIDSEEACLEYLRTLEAAIDTVQQSKREVILSLSGGRKGMAVLTLFAAQKYHIRSLYHTLILDEKLSDKIDEKTSISALNEELDKKKRNDRLFLREYDEGQAYSKFTLFKVPVLFDEDKADENKEATGKS